MGNTIAVDVWGQWFGEDQYTYVRVYSGESFFGALRAMWAHRKYGCIKLEWRPVRS